MIPPFNDDSVLPPGVYLATLDEIEARFGTESELRRVQMQSVRWMVDLAKRAGAKRVVLNGSFATAIMEPNDVDCVLLFTEQSRRNMEAVHELEDGLPFLDVAVVNQADFDILVEKHFSMDRFGILKGMVEVVLWN